MGSATEPDAAIAVTGVDVVAGTSSEATGRFCVALAIVVREDGGPYGWRNYVGVFRGLQQGRTVRRRARTL